MEIPKENGGLRGEYHGKFVEHLGKYRKTSGEWRFKI
jgi:hypothetical protein